MGKLKAQQRKHEKTHQVVPLQRPYSRPSTQTKILKALTTTDTCKRKKTKNGQVHPVVPRG